MSTVTHVCDTLSTRTVGLCPNCRHLTGLEGELIHVHRVPIFCFLFTSCILLCLLV